MITFPSALPLSRVPDPMSSPGLRWGILAPGVIARLFTRAVHGHTRQRVVAVGSRSAERAAAFAAEFGVPRSYGSYQQLVEDPEVDVVYVASPHSEHRDHALLAIAAGKPVLVEKAFTRTASEAAEVVAASRAAGVLAMEAMWTRFLPQTDVTRQLLEGGTFGALVTFLADHGINFIPDPESRLFSPALAGGAMLDLGVYPVSYAYFVLGAPDHVTAVGDLTSTGVDRQVSAVLKRGQAHAVFNTTLAAATPTTASICGTAARMDVSGPFYSPVPQTLISTDGKQRLEWQPEGIRGHDGLCYEADHFAQLVADGALESPVLPLDETLAIMETIDQIRGQVGALFPDER